MELQTQITPTKTQLDKIDRIEYNNNSQVIIVHFTKATQIGGEKSDYVFDNSNPVFLELSKEIEEALNVLFTNAFQSRTKQLNAIEETSSILVAPDYKSFYQELLINRLFRAAQFQASQNLLASLAYNEFAIALTNAIAGNENTEALQVCLNNILEIIKSETELEDLDSFKKLLEKYRIPILVIY